MIEYTIAYPGDAESPAADKEKVADFLYEHLDQYGDKREDIMKCLNYALSTDSSQGGMVLTAQEDGKVLGAVIINNTGMSGYIPENILVYIAVRGNQRGRGIGKALMKRIIDATDGDIALHVEPDNPARNLYEKYGFTNKYLEMRLKKA